MKLKVHEHVTSVSHAGAQYDADEHGHIDVHQDHVKHFLELGFTVVEAEEAAETIEKAGNIPTWTKK